MRRACKTELITNAFLLGDIYIYIYHIADISIAVPLIHYDFLTSRKSAAEHIQPKEHNQLKKSLLFLCLHGQIASLNILFMVESFSVGHSRHSQIKYIWLFQFGFGLGAHVQKSHIGW